ESTHLGINRSPMFLARRVNRGSSWGQKLYDCRLLYHFRNRSRWSLWSIMFGVAATPKRYEVTKSMVAALKKAKTSKGFPLSSSVFRFGRNLSRSIILEMACVVGVLWMSDVE